MEIKTSYSYNYSNKDRVIKKNNVKELARIIENKLTPDTNAKNSEDNTGYERTHYCSKANQITNATRRLEKVWKEAWSKNESANIDFSKISNQNDLQPLIEDHFQTKNLGAQLNENLAHLIENDSKFVKPIYETIKAEKTKTSYKVNTSPHFVDINTNSYENHEDDSNEINDKKRVYIPAHKCSGKNKTDTTLFSCLTTKTKPDPFWKQVSEHAKNFSTNSISYKGKDGKEVTHNVYSLGTLTKKEQIENALKDIAVTNQTVIKLDIKSSYWMVGDYNSIAQEQAAIAEYNKYNNASIKYLNVGQSSNYNNWGINNLISTITNATGDPNIQKYSEIITQLPVNFTHLDDAFGYSLPSSDTNLLANRAMKTAYLIYLLQTVGYPNENGNFQETVILAGCESAKDRWPMVNRQLNYLHMVLNEIKNNASLGEAQKQSVFFDCVQTTKDFIKTHNSQQDKNLSESEKIQDGNKNVNYTVEDDPIRLAESLRGLQAQFFGSKNKDQAGNSVVGGLQKHYESKNGISVVNWNGEKFVEYIPEKPSKVIGT